MAAPRLLLLHDHPQLLQDVEQICRHHGAALQAVASQSEIVEILARGCDRPDLVIAKDVAPDWFTVGAALLACRRHLIARFLEATLGEPESNRNRVDPKNRPPDVRAA